MLIFRLTFFRHLPPFDELCPPKVVTRGIHIATFRVVFRGIIQTVSLEVVVDQTTVSLVFGVIVIS